MFALQCSPVTTGEAELHARDNTRMISPDEARRGVSDKSRLTDISNIRFYRQELRGWRKCFADNKSDHSDSLLYSIAACEKLTRRWLYPGRGTRAHCEPPEADKACFGFAQLQPSMVILTTHTSILASTTRSGVVLIYKVLPINLLAPPSSEHHAMINLSCVQIN